MSSRRVFLRLPIFLLPVLATLSLLATAVPVYATCDPHSYNVFFNGDPNDWTDWTNDYPESYGVDSGEGDPAPSLGGAAEYLSGPNAWYIGLSIDFEDDQSVVAYVFNYHTVGGAAGNVYLDFEDSAHGLIERVQIAGADTGDGWERMWAVGIPPIEGVRYAHIFMNRQGEVPSSMWVDNISIQVAGDVPGGCTGLTRPFTATDENADMGLFDYASRPDALGIGGQLDATNIHPNDNLVIAGSNAPGDDVYAAAGGTITWIQSPGEFNCADAGFNYFAQVGNDCFVSFSHNDSNPLYIEVYRIDLSTAYLVSLQLADTSVLSYLVEDAPNFINDGMTIDAGCILGKSVALHGVLPSELSSLSIGIPDTGLNYSWADQGATFIEWFSTVDQNQADTLPLADVLTIYPDPGRACNADPAFATCLGSNPRFLRNGDGWTSTGSVFYADGGGAILNPGSQVMTTLPLDGESTYNVTVGGIDTHGDSSALIVRIGSTADTFPVDSSTERVLLDSATPASPSLPGIYQIGVKNTGNFAAFIDFVCVTPGGTTGTPGGCTFTNHSFDDAAGATWTNGGVVTFGGDGTAFMPDAIDGSLSQAWDLPAGDYTLSARVRAHYTPSDIIPASPSADIDLLYTFDGGETGLGSLVFSSVDPGFQILTTTFTLSGETSDTFTFYLDINSGSTELDGLTIDRFCLERTGGYDGGGGGYPPPLATSCEVIANPNTSDVATWISWHWAQLNRFFRCDLMVLLNNFYIAVRTGIDSALRFFRYVLAVIQYSAHWLATQLTPWLNGHFNNIAYGRVTTITESGGGSCHDLFCVLDDLINNVLGQMVGAVTRIVDFILWLLTQAVSLVISLISTLIGLLLVVLGTIVRLFQMMLGYLQSLVLGFNSATPTPLPGLPQCQLDPQGNAVCIGLWMLENTVFADEGQLYIPLLIGALSIGLLFWAADTFRKKLADVGEKL